jgi:hypothetical protein
MITLTGGGIQGPNNVVVPDGSITFTLNMDATVIASPYGLVRAAIPVTFQFDSNGNLIQPVQIWSNAELNPQNSSGYGTFYYVAIYDSNGALVSEPGTIWQFAQAANSSVNISTMTSLSPSGPFYPYPFSGSGTVLSVALQMDGVIYGLSPLGSPVTTIGTLIPQLLTQGNNQFLAGPVSGGPATPTFRSIQLSDLPALNFVTSVGLIADGVIYASSVAGSPVTSSGSFTLGLLPQSAATFLAGPITGSATAPAFRAIAMTDLGASPTNTKFLRGDGVWIATGAGTGTVTSVSFTGDGVLFTATPDTPVTVSGTLTPSLIAQANNSFLAGPTTGGPLAPTFRAMAIADLPATGTPSSTTFLRGDGTWSAVSGAAGGTVTSVGFTGDGTVFNASVTGSPVTSAGTFAPSLHTQANHTVLIGPTTGGPLAPTFRLLALSDLPFTGTPSSTTVARGDGTWAPYNAGTVTSVGMTGDGVIYNASVSGSPVTGAGTLAQSLLSQANGAVLIGPVSGGPSTPTFRTLQNSDLPSRVASFSYVIDGGGSVPTTGIKGQLCIPTACTITGWVLTADQSGSAVVDVLRASYSAFPTTTSIASTDKPTLSSAQKNENLAVSVWTTAINAGDEIQFNLNSATTVTRLNITVLCTIP